MAGSACAEYLTLPHRQPPFNSRISDPLRMKTELQARPVRERRRRLETRTAAIGQQLTIVHESRDSESVDIGERSTGPTRKTRSKNRAEVRRGGILDQKLIEASRALEGAA